MPRYGGSMPAALEPVPVGGVFSPLSQIRVEKLQPSVRAALLRGVSHPALSELYMLLALPYCV
ncbi:MAG: hypothetical protein L6W00_02960 [Lentisphaeria bacterium]|nr:MAG: hypothetical protein L6W00_02960 [Lentisphaeria bacterium]